LRRLSLNQRCHFYSRWSDCDATKML